MRERDPKEGECPNTLVRITLAPEAAQQVNITFHTVQLLNVTETIRANGETRYPPSKYARVAPRIAGVVRAVKASLGQEVEAGAALATIESIELGQSKSDLLSAAGVLDLRQQTYDQEKQLFDKKITAGRELLQAKTELEEAKLSLARAQQRLTLLGLTLDQAKDGSPLMDVVAPFKGIVVEATAVPGEIAAPDRPIFAVADAERLWVAIDVYESDLAKVEKDQRVTFTVEGLAGKRFSGRVIAIGGAVDDRTRTVPVYADVKNVQGLLRANMFGQAEIAVKPAEQKLLAPKEAVQYDGDCYIVFVSPTKDVFQARKVELGAAYSNSYEIVGGLAVGDKIVTTGSFLLKTEILRGQMGAG